MSEHQPPPQQQRPEVVLEFQPSWILVPVVIMAGFLIYNFLSEGAVSVKYKADVKDYNDKKKSFEFNHPLRRRGQLKDIRSDEQKSAMMLQYVAESHELEMLKAERWGCIECGKKAVKLITHPQNYLHLTQPMIIDMPGPICSNKECLKSHEKNFAEMLRQVEELNSTQSDNNSKKKD